MSYKPDEKDLMAYLYGELEGNEKEKIEQYLIQNPNARNELDSFQQLRTMLRHVEDKEVIAPPVFISDQKQRWLWNAPYFKTIVSIAASLLIVILVGRFTQLNFSTSGNEFRLSFGEPKPAAMDDVKTPAQGLTQDDVQQMINRSLTDHQVAIQANLDASQKQLNESIRRNLAVTSGRMDDLVRQASSASKEQIQQYVAVLQNENMQMVKDYFQLTNTEQKQYIESLLVDFAKYLQQQRNDDLQIVQLRLNSIEQNTTVFQNETEQILAGIISTVGTPASKETRN